MNTTQTLFSKLKPKKIETPPLLTPLISYLALGNCKRTAIISLIVISASSIPLTGCGGYTAPPAAELPDSPEAVSDSVSERPEEASSAPQEQKGVEEAVPSTTTSAHVSPSQAPNSQPENTSTIREGSLNPYTQYQAPGTPQAQPVPAPQAQPVPAPQAQPVPAPQAQPVPAPQASETSHGNLATINQILREEEFKENLQNSIENHSTSNSSEPSSTQQNQTTSCSAMDDQDKALETYSIQLVPQKNGEPNVPDLTARCDTTFDTVKAGEPSLSINEQTTEGSDEITFLNAIPLNYNTDGTEKKRNYFLTFPEVYSGKQATRISFTHQATDEPESSSSVVHTASQDAVWPDHENHLFSISLAALFPKGSQYSLYDVTPSHKQSLTINLHFLDGTSKTFLVNFQVMPTLPKIGYQMVVPTPSDHLSFIRNMSSGETPVRFESFTNPSANPLNLWIKFDSTVNEAQLTTVLRESVRQENTSFQPKTFASTGGLTLSSLKVKTTDQAGNLVEGSETSSSIHDKQWIPIYIAAKSTTHVTWLTKPSQNTSQREIPAKYMVRVVNPLLVDCLLLRNSLTYQGDPDAKEGLMRMTVTTSAIGGKLIGSFKREVRIAQSYLSEDKATNDDYNQSASEELNSKITSPKNVIELDEYRTLTVNNEAGQVPVLKLPQLGPQGVFPNPETPNTPDFEPVLDTTKVIMIL